MTEEKTLPENGWAILATIEAKKHPKWDVMTNSINLLNAHIENYVWVGMDMDGNVRNGDFDPQSFTCTVITMNDWCDMNKLSRTNPTLEEEINAVKPEFDPNQPFETSNNNEDWQTVTFDGAPFKHYVGLNSEGMHVIEAHNGYFHTFNFIRNIKDTERPTVYDMLADHLDLKETFPAGHYEDEFGSKFLLTKYGFKRLKE